MVTQEEIEATWPRCPKCGQKLTRDDLGQYCRMCEPDMAEESDIYYDSLNEED